jgi:hypothetical protein
LKTFLGIVTGSVDTPYSRCIVSGDAEQFLLRTFRPDPRGQTAAVRITLIDHRVTWLMIVNGMLPVRLPELKIDELEPGSREIVAILAGNRRWRS